MAKCIHSITAENVVVFDPEGVPQSVPVRLTPRKRFLTQDTKRRLIATGFLHHLTHDWAVDPALIGGALKYINERICALLDGDAK